eukprot:GHVT01008928.1.p2 GENE.GHVT01008928.1~~GHVT01008928.1.p2  ORF type:complete len:177 (-),score=29.54 GHVT01008928.1:4388-4918(-)
MWGGLEAQQQPTEKKSNTAYDQTQQEHEKEKGGEGKKGGEIGEGETSRHTSFAKWPIPPRHRDSKCTGLMDETITQKVERRLELLLDMATKHKMFVTRAGRIGCVTSGSFRPSVGGPVVAAPAMLVQLRELNPLTFFLSASPLQLRRALARNILKLAQACRAYSIRQNQRVYQSSN